MKSEFLIKAIDKLNYIEYNISNLFQGGVQFSTGGKVHEPATLKSRVDLVKFQNRRYSPDERIRNVSAK